MNDEQGLSRVFSLVLLVATAMLGWISFKDSRELPGIVGDRNTVTVPAMEQNVTARLWEDPLQAVQAEVDTPNRAVRTTQSIRESIANRVSKNKKIGVLLVPIPATPFPDDLEVRLRLRYSAQMALAQENFAPENRDALGYFQIRVENALPSGEALAADRNKAKNLNVPYEWFVPRQKGSNLDVLLLWLPELYLSEDTLPRLATLVDHLAPLTNKTVNHELVGIFVVGPRSSDTLKHMVPAYAAPPIGPPHPNILALRGKFCIFSPQATTPDPLLGLQEQYLWRAARKNLADQFLSQFGDSPGESDNWQYFHNFISPDDQLTDLLIAEMGLRGLSFEPGSTDKILVLAEADTAYGRSLPLALQASLQSYRSNTTHFNTTATLRSRTPSIIANLGENPPPDPQLRIYRYLRGLDQQKGNQGKHTPANADKSRSPEEALTQVLSKDGAMALGESQLDYADRLIELIHRSGDANEIKAVGILGGDLYDKLILLRSLRSSFPGAVFFTTDLDARMWHPHHLPFTRNLLVASAYGVSGEGDGQDKLASEGIAPFRDVYQVAVFRAFRAALKKAAAPAFGVPPAPAPSLFELGRNWPEKLALPNERPRGDSISWMQGLIFTTQRSWEVARSHFSGSQGWVTTEKGWTLFGAGMMLGLSLWVARDRASKRTWEKTQLGRAFSPETGRLGAWILVTVLALASFHFILGRIGDEPGEEAWRWRQGVSIWPTEMTRLLIVLGVMSVIGWAWRRHSAYRSQIIHDYFPNANISLPRGAAGRFSSLWQRWPETGDSTKSISATEVYQVYVNKARPWCRFIRVAMATSAYMFLAFGMMFVIDGALPARPHVRGDTARWVDFTMLNLSIICFLGLVFYVLDAVSLSARLLRGISAGPTQWPPSLLERYAIEFGVKRRDLPGYLDVKFAAEKSCETGKLVFMPFIIQFLFILSRSNYFDNWTWPASLIAIFVCNILLACTAWTILRRSARKIRETAHHEIQAGLNEVARELARSDDEASREDVRSAVGPRAHERKVGLLALQKEITEERRGAYAQFFQDPALLAMLIPTGLLGLLTVLFRAFLGRV